VSLQEKRLFGAQGEPPAKLFRKRKEMGAQLLADWDLLNEDVG